MANIIIDGGTISPSIGAGSSSASGSKSIVLRTKDTYVLEDIQVNVSASASATPGTFANSVPSAQQSSYTELTAQTNPELEIPADGYLYMSGGWYPKQKIALGTFIPDDTGLTNAGTDQIRHNYEAYDTDGHKLVGTMVDVTPAFDGGVVTTQATTHYTAPSASIEPKGTLIPGNGQTQLGDDYGVTVWDDNIHTEAQDGVKFLTIDAGLANVQNGSVYSTSTANRTDVLYDGDRVGYLSVSDNTVALSAPSTAATNTSSTTNIVVSNIVSDAFPRYVIPIMHPQGRGGDVTRTGQSGTVTCSVDDITMSNTGAFVTSAATNAYGVHSYTPTPQNPDPTGTDGSSYLAIKTTGSGGAATVSGTIYVNYNRADVTSDAAYKGLVNMSLGSTLLSSDTGSLEANVSTNATTQINGESYYYIDIVSPQGSAPTITKTSSNDTLSWTTNPSVEVKIGGTFKPGSGSNEFGDEYGIWKDGDGNNQIPQEWSDGTDYLVLETHGVKTQGTLSGTATITYTRGAVNANNTYKGAVSMTTSTELVAEATNQTITSNTITKNINPDVTNEEKYIIPIVTEHTATVGSTGTGVSKNNSGHSGAVEGTQPVVTVTSTGTLVSNLATYGGTTGTLSGEYVDITVGASSTTPEWTGSATIAYTRGTVNAGQDWKGLISVSQGTQLASSQSGTLTHTLTSKTVNPTIGGTNGTTYKIPKVKASASGAVLPDGSITISATGGNTSGATPSVNVYSFDIDGTIGTQDCGNDFGITTTAPVSHYNEWVSLDPSVAIDNVAVSASITVQPSAVTVSCDPGITTGGGTGFTPTAKTYTGSSNVAITPNSGQSRYAKIVEPEATAGCTITTAPTVTTCTSASMDGGTGHPTTVPNGIRVTTTEPSDLHTYASGYIVINPGTSASTNGLATATAQVDIGAGMTKQQTDTDTDTENITTTVYNSGAKTYIKVWNMGYNVDGENTTYYGTVS